MNGMRIIGCVLGLTMLTTTIAIAQRGPAPQPGGLTSDANLDVHTVSLPAPYGDRDEFDMRESILKSGVIVQLKLNGKEALRKKNDINGDVLYLPPDERMYVSDAVRLSARLSSGSLWRGCRFLPTEHRQKRGHNLHFILHFQRNTDEVFSDSSHGFYVSVQLYRTEGEDEQTKTIAAKTVLAEDLADGSVDGLSSATSWGKDGKPGTDDDASVRLSRGADPSSVDELIVFADVFGFDVSGSSYEGVASRCADIRSKWDGIRVRYGEARRQSHGDVWFYKNDSYRLPFHDQKRPYPYDVGDLSITAYSAPYPDSPNWSHFFHYLQKLRGQEGKRGIGDRSETPQAAVRLERIRPRDLITASFPLWMGEVNPGKPFYQERGNTVLLWCEVAHGERFDLSPRNVSLRVESTDDEGLFTAEYGVDDAGPMPLKQLHNALSGESGVRHVKQESSISLIPPALHVDASYKGGPGASPQERVNAVIKHLERQRPWSISVTMQIHPEREPERVVAEKTVEFPIAEADASSVSTQATASSGAADASGGSTFLVIGLGVVMLGGAGVAVWRMKVRRA